jgi:glycosyltransferase involved in cell wall biosynthesis
MSHEKDVTAVIINYKTFDLTQRAIKSFRSYYPDVPLLLIDNGSNDDSTFILEKLVKASPTSIELIINDKNIHHGPAMHQAIQRTSSEYILFIDSDCEIRQGGFIELMLNLLSESDQNYVVGKKVYMNNRGFDVDKNDSSAIEYIRPICMLLRREIYLKLPKFVKHGTPCLENMKEAVRQGYRLIDFPIEKYILHQGRGTAGRFGYQLGWKGRWNYLMNKLGL